jgi:hypothetical protein
MAFVRTRPDGDSRIEYSNYYDYQDGYRAAPVTHRGDHTDRDPTWVPRPAWDAVFDAQAQENLTAAADAAQSIRNDTGTFENATTTQMYEALPALSYVAAGVASTQDAVISVNPDSDTWAGAAMSSDGTCFLIKITEGVGRTYGQSITCTGSAADAAADPSWA